MLFQCIHSSSLERNTEELEFHTILQKHADNLSSLSSGERAQLKGNRDRIHILLTGSTGFVGSYMINTLSRYHGVQRITCIDRWTDDRSVFANTTSKRKSVEVEHLLGQLDQDNFNLLPTVYSDLLASVTVILHCQWPMNFNQQLISFEPHIQGVANLAQFAHAPKYNPRIIFLLSVSAVMLWDRDIPVPEKSLSDPKHANAGYGQSKLLTSRLLEEAGRSIGTRSSICRVGQVAGPVGRIVSQRLWPRANWFPILLDASKFMGCIPDSLGKASRIDWIPVAKALAELVVLDHHEEKKTVVLTDYYHLVSPKSSRYEDFVPLISQRLAGKEIIPLSEWVGRLEKSATTTEKELNPGLNLLSFFQDLESTQADPPVMLETKHTEEHLPQLNKISAIDVTRLEGWLDQWDSNTRNW